MKKLLLIVLLGIMVVSCRDTAGRGFINSRPGPDKKKGIEDPKKEMVSPGCYVFHDNESRITLEILTAGKTITGNLIFKISGKDVNAGTFTAELRNNVMLGNYIFNAEGEVSARQIAFKVNGDHLLEGFGELNSEGTAFKDTSKLHYNSEMPFVKTKCVEE